MQEKNTVVIPVATDIEGPWKFFAGSCILLFGGIPLETHVAMVQHEDRPGSRERWISTRADIVTWLMNRGLPGNRAIALVDGTGDHVHEELIVNQEVKE